MIGFASNFGGNFISHGGIQVQKRLTIFSYFICGIIVWICFRATIIARLSQKQLKLPFKDLSGILNTDYLLTTAPIAWANGQKWAKASPGTVPDKIFKNNMDIEKSFNGAVQGMEELKKQPLRAHYNDKQVGLHNYWDP